MKCYGDASFSKRITEETQIELIGGKESYLAVCRGCYASNSPNSKTIDSAKKQLVDLTNIENLSNQSCLNATRIGIKNSNDLALNLAWKWMINKYAVLSFEFFK